MLICTIRLLYGLVEWDAVSVHYSQFHDPGIQYERRPDVLRSADCLRLGAWQSPREQEVRPNAGGEWCATRPRRSHGAQACREARPRQCVVSERACPTPQMS